MRLPLTVRWMDERLSHEALSETRDVSSRGLCFTLPKAPKSASAVEIHVTLPNQLTQAGVRVLCHGRVVRVSSGGPEEMSVVAATIERFQFYGQQRIRTNIWNP